MPARTGKGRQRKGRQFEREIILDLWRSIGVEPPWKKHARPDGGFVPPPLFANWRLEMKFQERLNIWGALDQAEEDAGKGEAPAVIFKRSRAPTYVAIPYEVWKELVLNKEHLHGKEEE
jgi:hypothetical protein